MSEESEFAELAPWLVAVLTLVGVGLRVLLLGSSGMGLDETVSVWLANHSVGEVLHWTARIDQHPPLYYLLLHAWMGLNGASPYDVRLLSVLFGAATIPVIYLTGKRMAGATVGFAAAVLLALSPFNIRFAQDARMYTCLTFSAAVASYALVRLLTDSRTAQPIGGQFRAYVRAWRTPPPVVPSPAKAFSYKVDASDRAGWQGWVARHHWSPLQTVETDLAWVVFVLFSAATLLTHNTAVLFVLATNIFVLGLLLYRRSNRPQVWKDFRAPSLSDWVKAQIGILLLWSPWALPFVRQASAVFEDFWLPKPTWDTVGQALKSLLNAATPTPAGAHESIALWAVYALVLVLGVVRLRRNLAHFFFLAALVAIPVLGELLVSLRRPVFYDRTLIWLSIPLLLLLAVGIAQLRFRPLVLLALAALASVNLFSAADYYRFAQNENWNDAAGYVSLFAEKGDLVLFNEPRAQIPFDYYFSFYEDRYGVLVEKHGVPVDIVEDGIVGSRITESDIPGIALLLNGRRRAWLVSNHRSFADPAGLVPQTLAATMHLTRQRDFHGGQVQLYEAP